VGAAAAAAVAAVAAVAAGSRFISGEMREGRAPDSTHRLSPFAIPPLKPLLTNSEKVFFFFLGRD